MYIYYLFTTLYLYILSIHYFLFIYILYIHYFLYVYYVFTTIYLYILSIHYSLFLYTIYWLLFVFIYYLLTTLCFYILSIDYSLFLYTIYSLLFILNMAVMFICLNPTKEICGAWNLLDDFISIFFDFSQRRMWSPAQHLRLEFFAKTVNDSKPLIIFAKKLHRSCSIGF